MPFDEVAHHIRETIWKHATAVKEHNARHRNGSQARMSKAPAADGGA
jgi:hypothetical protein